MSAYHQNGCECGHDDGRSDTTCDRCRFGYVEDANTRIMGGLVIGAVSATCAVVAYPACETLSFIAMLTAVYSVFFVAINQRDLSETMRSGRETPLFAGGRRSRTPA